MRGSVKPAPLCFPLVARRKPVSFPGGSASGSGGRPGLQNQWHVLRGAFGGFDSHALPPPTGMLHRCASISAGGCSENRRAGLALEVQAVALLERLRQTVAAEVAIR